MARRTFFTRFLLIPSFLHSGKWMISPFDSFPISIPKMLQIALDLLVM